MNRERYIERVLDLIIRDTVIEDLEIVYPFNQPLYSLQTNMYLPLHKNFYEYCKNQYGLTMDECKYVWYEYGINRYDEFINTINEVYSFGHLVPQVWDVKDELSKYNFNSEGHYKFFMRLYNKIIDSIGLVHSSGNNIDILYINEFGRTKEGFLGLNVWLDNGDPDVDFKSFSKRYTDYIFRCCIDLMTEVLPDDGQYVAMVLSDMVLQYIYENVFQNRILQKKFNLNESDRGNLNEVYTFGSLEHTDWDVREILGKYGFTGERYYKYFMSVYNSIINSIEVVNRDDSSQDTLYLREFSHTDHSVLGLTVYRDGDPDENFKLFSQIYTEYIFKGCISLLTEGLGKEGNYVSIMLVDMVMEYIYKTIFKNNSLNESEDRMDRFVDKVLEFLKDDTYEVEPNLIHVPYLNEPISISHTKKTKHNILDLVSFMDVPQPSFVIYCVEQYGLDPKYIRTLWNQYRVFLMDNFHRLKKIY